MLLLLRLSLRTMIGDLGRPFSRASNGWRQYFPVEGERE